MKENLKRTTLMQKKHLQEKFKMNFNQNANV